MLMVYNYDSDEHKSELFSSYSCGNEILTLDWSHSENAPNSGLVVYGTQEGTLGVFNSLSNTLLHETTVEGVSAVVDVAFSPVMTSYCSALASGPSPLRFWDLASGAMALDGARAGAECTPFSIATGVSAAPFLQEIIDMARKTCGNIRGTVYPVRNRFFGETITVSGLITGRDLMEQLRGRALGERLLIPANMLRTGERVFLDDVTVAQLEQALGVPVIPVPAESGFDLVDAILGLEVEAPAYALPPEDEYYRYNPGT